MENELSDKRKKIAQIIETELGYTNGWRVDDETYEGHCFLAADQILKLFEVPIGEVKNKE